MKDLSLDDIMSRLSGVRQSLGTHIREIISEHTKLTETGRDLHGSCPFCKHESAFTVSESKGMWYCFGCGRGGDAFSFLQALPHTKPIPEIISELLNRFNTQN